MAEEPVQILVLMAKRGEIDPWNIDIINVTDKFLKKVDEMRELDLRITGRTLFYAATLLRIKAESLEDECNQGRSEDDSDIEMELPDDGYEKDEDQPVYPVLIPKIKRRLKRPVTLEELIGELKKAEKVEYQRKRRKIQKEQHKIVTDDLIKIAYDENIEENIEEMESILEKEFKRKDCVLFSDLIKGTSNIITTYISLLFLASREKIYLEQKELYGELYIRRKESGES